MIGQMAHDLGNEQPGLTDFGLFIGLQLSCFLHLVVAGQPDDWKRWLFNVCCLLQKDRRDPDLRLKPNHRPPNRRLIMQY